MQNKLGEKTAIVTGGTKGIGLAICEALGSEGCRIVLCGREQATVNQVVERLQENEVEARGIVADVKKAKDISELVDLALEQSTTGAIDILVNNAGRPGGGPTAQIEDELWYDVIETNLNSVFRMTREVLQRGRMKENGWGRIINIASTGGKQGVRFGAPYSASKHGVVGFSKALGLELATTGITVNSVCPGFVETGLAQHVRKGFSELWKCSLDEVKRRIEERIPTGRYVSPEEVADMVRFVASPMSSSITAQAINVCGGLGNY